MQAFHRPAFLVLLTFGSIFMALQSCRREDTFGSNNELRIVSPADGATVMPGRLSVDWTGPTTDFASIRIVSLNVLTVHQRNDTLNGVTKDHHWESANIVLPGCTYTCSLANRTMAAASTFQVAGLDAAFPDTIFGTWNDESYNDWNGYSYYTSPGSIVLGSNNESAVVHVGPNAYTIAYERKSGTFLRYYEGGDGNHEWLEVDLATGKVEFEVRNQYGMGSSSESHFTSQ